MSKITKKSYRFSIIIAVYILVITSCESKISIKKVQLLTIGNSFSVNACKNLVDITNSVPGCKISITTANIGGSTFEKHASLIAACREDSTLKPYYEKYTLKDIVSRDTFEIVTIQQRSSQSFKYETYQPFADSVYNFVRKHAPSAKIMIHQTWAYSPKCSRLEEYGITRSEMHAGLVNAYDKLAKLYGVELLPSGDAFNRSYLSDSTIYLWKDVDYDHYHANEVGEYLAGCVWFGTLFDVSPLRIAYVPENMDIVTAQFLREIAAETVKAYH